MRMAKIRALESPSNTICRQEQNRVYMAKQQALESPSETMDRQGKNRTRMANKRTASSSVDSATTMFLSKIKSGPDFVCICCHHIMYRQNVVPCNKSKYAKASDELLNQVFCVEYSYICNDGKEWICGACDSALSRGKMPVQAKANNFKAR